MNKMLSISKTMTKDHNILTGKNYLPYKHKWVEERIFLSNLYCKS